MDIEALGEITTDLSTIDKHDVLLMGRNCKLSTPTRLRLAARLAKKMRRKKLAEQRKRRKERKAKNRAEYHEKKRPQMLAWFSYYDYTSRGKYNQIRNHQRRWDPERKRGFDLTFEEFDRIFVEVTSVVDVYRLSFKRVDISKPMSISNIVVLDKETKEIYYTSNNKDTKSSNT